MVEASAAHVVAAPTAADTHRDLAAIAEINRLMYRQPTPREVLATTAAEIGKHLGVTRCMVAVGAAGEGAQLTAEYSHRGSAQAGAAQIATIAGLISKVSPDALGGIELQAATTPALRDLGLDRRWEWC